jgi:hypothetical protein
MIYFMDLEASSLMPGGFPIEIAWVDEAGHSETYLIRPADAWLDEDRDHPNWSWQSEQVHGIRLTTLLSEGVPHGVVARRAAEVLASPTAVVCSDGVQFDGGWLERLFQAADLSSSIRLTDIFEVYGMACRPLLSLLPPAGSKYRERGEEIVRGIARQIVATAEAAEDGRPGVRHRALEDAERLWRTWRAISIGVAQQLGQKPT